ncbi:MAG TPA: hypothetical protein VH518_08725, partial [Tepidisphaeraceae bacterium]
RKREKLGLYGARMTDRGCGGTVAVLGEGARFDEAIQEIIGEYGRQTGLKAELLQGPSGGAWEAGTSALQSD